MNRLGARVALRAISVLFLVSLVLLQVGCFAIKGQAPVGPDVKLLPPNTPVEKTVRYQKWFAAWGIFPLSESDRPEDIIAREKLVEARVLTEDSVEDLFSGIVFVLVFPVGIILPQTVIVEGNRTPRYYKNRGENRSTASAEQTSRP